ncbi:hypothetical protein GCM10010278_74380 [Streptomyces melanogenes]|nr:hypothetical protein GCM10010278_74380 [Streptomyces melanogenes]
MRLHRGDQQAGHQIAEGVHEHGERCAHDLDQHPGDQRTGRAGDRVGLLHPGVPRVELFLGDQPWHVRLVGRVEEQAQHPEGEDEQAQCGDGQPVQRVERGDRTEQDRASDIRGDQDRLAPAAVHHHSGHQPEEQVRNPAGGVDESHLRGGRAQRHRGEDLEGEPGHLRTEGRYGRSGPETYVTRDVYQARHDRTVPAAVAPSATPDGAR